MPVNSMTTETNTVSKNCPLMDLVAADIFNQKFKGWKMAENKPVKTFFYKDQPVQEKQKSRDQ